MPLSTLEVEVMAKPTRRRYSAEYKLRILREATPVPVGEIGALLRREGLYSSNLVWRKQWEKRELEGLRRRGVGLYPRRTTPWLIRSSAGEGDFRLRARGRAG